MGGVIWEIAVEGIAAGHTTWWVADGLNSSNNM
jgi:hypothetical protein